ncbi:MAG: PorV/PorQ family protein [Elusimicrobia bacterium]|nr:PorV/PorQ family protein [Elusimicrobiota bacterium]
MRTLHAIRTLSALALLLASAAAPLRALEDPRYFSKKAVGTTTADFLNLSVGARAAAMAGAYTAVSEEASAVYWNPAGLVQIPKLSAVFMRAQYLEDISYQYAAYAHRLSYDSVLAGSVMLTDIGSITETDISGNTLGSFTPKDQVFTLSYSKAILEFSDKDIDVSVGVSAKYLRSQIVHSAKAYAGDIGVMTYNFSDIPYRLAVTATNMGGGLSFDQESNPIPLTFKLGAAVNPFRNFLVATDFVMPKHNSPSMRLGAELATTPNELTRLCVRAGLDSQRLRDSLGGFTMGVGATLHFFSLDYAFVPMGELGSTHRISLTFDFPFRSPIFQRRDRTIFTKMKGISFK